MWIKVLAFFFIAFFTFSCRSEKALLIIHTNDTHSQVETINSSNKAYNNLGGYANRWAILDSIRKTGTDFLLLDAGDFLQGTAYFNFFAGEIEAKAFNMMQYDAICLGNHEFDNGVAALTKVISTIETPVVCSNYDFNKSPLAPYVKPYFIIKKNGLKIGIIGLGINPDGLISSKNFSSITYLNPIEMANKYAVLLKKELNCDVIICLSHLGDDSPQMNDMLIAQNTRYIDLIIGGHTHKLINELSVKNLDNKEIRIVQAGKLGAYLGYTQLFLKK